MKENDLTHGEFRLWLEKIGLSKSSANRFMKIAENPELNVPPVGHMGASVLYQLATLPKEEREKEHTTSKEAKLVKTWHFITATTVLKSPLVTSALKQRIGLTNSNVSISGLINHLF